MFDKSNVLAASAAAGAAGLAADRVSNINYKKNLTVAKRNDQSIAMVRHSDDELWKLEQRKIDAYVKQNNNLLTKEQATSIVQGCNEKIARHELERAKANNKISGDRGAPNPPMGSITLSYLNESQDQGFPEYIGDTPFIQEYFTLEDLPTPINPIFAGLLVGMFTFLIVKSINKERLDRIFDSIVEILRVVLYAILTPFLFLYALIVGFFNQLFP